MHRAPRHTLLLLALAMLSCRSPETDAPAAAGEAGRAARKAGTKPLAELSVVYAGDPDTPRTESFRKFLAEHVKTVRTVPVLDLARVDLADADVLVVDGVPITGKGDDLRISEAPRGVTLDALSVPTVLIGGMGGRVSDSLELKLGWRHG